MEEWPADSAYPSGHYCHTIGKIGDLATETEVLLLEYDVNTAPFSADVHACVPPLPWAVGPADHAAGYREDLRGTVVCSVDPPGCKDIDDALHARALPNGNIEVRSRIVQCRRLPRSAWWCAFRRRSNSITIAITISINRGS